MAPVFSKLLLEVAVVSIAPPMDVGVESLMMEGGLDDLVGDDRCDINLSEDAVLHLMEVKGECSRECYRTIRLTTDQEVTLSFPPMTVGYTVNDKGPLTVVADGRATIKCNKELLKKTTHFGALSKVSSARYVATRKTVTTTEECSQREEISMRSQTIGYPISKKTRLTQKKEHIVRTATGEWVVQIECFQPCNTAQSLADDAWKLARVARWKQLVVDKYAQYSSGMNTSLSTADLESRTAEVLKNLHGEKEANAKKYEKEQETAKGDVTVKQSLAKVYRNEARALEEEKKKKCKMPFVSAAKAW